MRAMPGVYFPVDVTVTPVEMLPAPSTAQTRYVNVAPVATTCVYLSAVPEYSTVPDAHDAGGAVVPDAAVTTHRAMPLVASVGRCV